MKVNVFETIYTELTSSKGKCLNISVCRPPLSKKLNIYFEELTSNLGKVVNKYNNFIGTGSFKIDLRKPDSIENARLKDFCHTFNLSKLLET